MAEQNLWWLGAILVLIGTICQNLGNNIVSVAHSNRHKEEEAEREERAESEAKAAARRASVDGSEGAVPAVPALDAAAVGVGSIEQKLIREDAEGSDNDAEEEKKNESWLHRHLWAIGSCIFVGGSLTNFVSFGYAAQSLLASLQSIQFVSNMIFAKVVHKEEVSSVMMAATGFIVAGNILVVFFSEHTAVKFTGTEIFNLWATNTAFHVYLGVMGSVALACEYTFRYYNEYRMKEGKFLWMHSFVESACYCTASSFVGQLAVMNAKCLSMYLTGGQAGVEFQHPPLYVALFVWLSFVTFWFRRMDYGLNLFPPLYFIPVLMISFVFINIVAGGIFFQEFLLFNTTQYIGFCIGAFCILLGVYFLAPANDMTAGEGDIELQDIDERSSAGKSIGEMRHRLSFMPKMVDEDIMATDPETVGGSPSLKVLAARVRAPTIRQPHPLAALKETSRRVTVVKDAANTLDDFFEGMEAMSTRVGRQSVSARLSRGMSFSRGVSMDSGDLRSRNSLRGRTRFSSMDDGYLSGKDDKSSVTDDKSRMTSLDEIPGEGESTKSGASIKTTSSLSEKARAAEEV